MTARPNRDESVEPLVEALAVLLPARARRGLLGALLSAVAAPPPSTGPCYDKVEAPKRPGF